MKTKVQTGNMLGVLIALLCLATNTFAGTPAFVTTFQVTTIVHVDEDAGTPDLKTVYQGPQESVWLPYDFTKWSCQVIARPPSDSRAHENIVCVHGDAAVGMSISCPDSAEGQDQNLFFIQSGHSTVSFNGSCQTKAADQDHKNKP